MLFNELALLVQIARTQRTQGHLLAYLVQWVHRQENADRETLIALTQDLHESHEALQAAIDANQPVSPDLKRGESVMANPVVGNLKAEVESTIGVIESAIKLISGIVDRIAAAVTAAIANGATEAELQPLNDTLASLRAEKDALAAAVAANQPPVVPTP